MGQAWQSNLAVVLNQGKVETAPCKWVNPDASDSGDFK